jgi:hypothetical protein
MIDYSFPLNFYTNVGYVNVFVNGGVVHVACERAVILVNGLGFYEYH